MRVGSRSLQLPFTKTTKQMRKEIVKEPYIVEHVRMSAVFC